MRTKKRAPPYGGFQGLIIKAFKCGKLKKSQIYARIISMILSDFYFYCFSAGLPVISSAENYARMRILGETTYYG